MNRNERVAIEQLWLARCYSKLPNYLGLVMLSHRTQAASGWDQAMHGDLGWLLYVWSMSLRCVLSRSTEAFERCSDMCFVLQDSFNSLCRVSLKMNGMLQ